MRLSAFVSSVLLLGWSMPSVAGPNLFKPLKHQPSHKMQNVKFLGWTADGDRFVLRTEHEIHLDTGDEEHIQWFRLYQVHDALTGKMIDSYRIKRTRPAPEDVGKEKSDHRPWRRNKLWRQAKPRKAWAVFKKATPLVAARPRNRSQSRRWSLSAKQVGRAPTPTKFEIKASGAGLHYEWYNIKKPVEKEGASPRATVFLNGAKQFRLLDFKMAIDGMSWCGEEDAKKGRKAKRPALVGDISSFWSPRGDRLVLTLFSKARRICLWPEGNSAGPDLARFYVRTAGPQIQLMASTGAEATARRLARKLASEGFPVTQLRLQGKPAKTEIYYRSNGDDGTALAQKVAKLLPGSPGIKPLKKKGWLRLIVVLGPQ